jgi:uncharacterized protein involved in tellurium resistance
MYTHVYVCIYINVYIYIYKYTHTYNQVNGRVTESLPNAMFRVEIEPSKQLGNLFLL